MTNDFETKLADLIWSLVEPKIDQKLAQFRDDLGTFDGDLDEKISEWMLYNFQADEFSYQIDGMIDAQLQYQAENGDLKEWLKGDDPEEDEAFEYRVFRAINNYYNIQLVRK